MCAGWPARCASTSDPRCLIVTVTVFVRVSALGITSAHFSQFQNACLYSMYQRASSKRFGVDTTREKLAFLWSDISRYNLYFAAIAQCAPRRKMSVGNIDRGHFFPQELTMKNLRLALISLCGALAAVLLFAAVPAQAHGY